MGHKAIALLAAALIMGMPGLGFAGEDSQKESAKAEQEAKQEAGDRDGNRQFAAVYIPPAKAAPRRTVGGATRGGH